MASAENEEHEFANNVEAEEQAEENEETEHEVEETENVEEEEQEEIQAEDEQENDDENNKEEQEVEENNEEHDEEHEEQEHDEQEQEAEAEADADEEQEHEQEAEAEAETEHEVEAEAETNEGEETNEKINESATNESGNEKNNTTADNDSDEEFAGFGEEEIKVTTKKAKKRQILSDDSDEEEEANKESEADDDDEEISKKKHKKHKKEHKSQHKKSSKKKNESKKNSDDENEEDNEVEDEDDELDEEKTKELVNELEDLQEEEEGIQPAQRPKESEEDEDSKESDKSEVVDNEPTSSKKKKGESDLEQMLKKQKAEYRKNKRRKNVDSEEITEMDNKISMIIAEMKNVAAEDRAANEKSLTAMQKLKMLPSVMNMLQKSEYHASMIELGVLGAIAEWLAPLPDRSLPNIKIREALIDALRDFGEINADYLKSSGVGKAVMFLYKHSKETKSNKAKLEKLINNWARPIFNLDSNFKQLTKEERLQRDMEHVKMLSKRGTSDTVQSQSVDDMLDASDKFKASKKIRHREEASGGAGTSSASDESKKHLRPGDPGFVPRARVPIPSSKDYVIRPKSNVDGLDLSTKKIKKTETRLEKHQKRFIEIKRNAKSSRAITMVAAGGK